MVNVIIRLMLIFFYLVLVDG